MGSKCSTYFRGHGHVSSAPIITLSYNKLYVSNIQPTNISMIYNSLPTTTNAVSSTQSDLQRQVITAPPPSTVTYTNPHTTTASNEISSTQSDMQKQVITAPPPSTVTYTNPHTTTASNEISSAQSVMQRQVITAPPPNTVTYTSPHTRTASNEISSAQSDMQRQVITAPPPSTVTYTNPHTTTASNEISSAQCDLQKQVITAPPPSTVTYTNPHTTTASNEIISVQSDMQRQVITAPPPNNPRTYNKRHGTSGINGQLYEISLAMWFLLQGETLSKNGALESFWLASNMEEADVFDDVIFQRKPSGAQENTKITLLQAKHKDDISESKYTVKFNTLHQKKSDVYLPKYFAAYLCVKEQPLFNNFKNQEFIIYTNALLDKKSEHHFNKILINSKSIWNINKQNFYFQLDFNRNKNNLVEILKYSTDCGQLARELAKSIESGSVIETKKHSFEKYRYSIKTRVFQFDKLNNDFVTGHSLSLEEREFRKSLIEELEKLPKYKSKSENEIISELKTMSFRISDPIKQSSPGFALPGDSVQEADIQEFLSKLKFFFNQPNVSELNKIIQSKLKSLYNLDNNDAKLIFESVENQVKNWWKEENNYLTEDHKLFEKAKQNLSKLELVALVKINIQKIKHLALTFKEYHLIRFRSFLRSAKVIHIVTDKTALLLNQTLLYQTLESMDECKPGYSNLRYIFMSLSDVLNLHLKVIEAFKTRECNLLVIECNTNNENLDLYTQLSSIVSEYRSKRIVLLAEDSNRFGRHLKMQFQSSGIYEEISHSSLTLNDLTEISQREILEKNIIFQGKQVQLKKVMLQGDAVTRLITAAELSLLINNKRLNIGEILPDLGDTVDYYIDRTFEQRRTINKVCFQKSYIDDWFAVSNIQEDELKALVSFERKVRKFSNKDKRKQNSQYIVLDNTLREEEDFKLLCNETKNTIHWLKKVTNRFTWQKSRGSLHNLCDFVNPHIVESIDNNEFKNRVVILGGEPGMGKSTSFIRLSNIAKTDDSSCWVMHINLPDHTQRLGNLKTIINEDEVIRFLMEAKEIGTNLEQEIFKLKLKKKQVVIYMDAFDEISPSYQDEVLKILEILQRTNVKQIFVSTRLHMTKNLEDRLFVLSYSLKPLDSNDQKQFLKKYWSKHLSINLKRDLNRTEEFITGLLDVLLKSISDREAAFTCIPLQTRMLAEVYQNIFKEFLESSGDGAHLPDKIDLFELYKHFMDKKMKIYCEEKLGLDETKPAIKGILETERQKYLSNHRLFAMDILYTSRLNELLSKDEINDLKHLKKNVNQGKENRGIVNKILQNELILVHRTFAEFFAADYFAVNINKQSIRTLLTKIYFKDEFSVQRHFLDRLLCNAEDDRFAMHLAVLNEDLPKLKDLLSSKAEAINIVDKAGRTALYLAVVQEDFDIVRILLAQKAHVNIRDRVFGMTALSHTSRTNNWRLAEMLLQNGACGSDLSIDLNNDKQYESKGGTLLHTAVEANYTKLLELMLDRGADLVNLFDDYRRTALHQAVINKRFKATRLLLEYNADTEIHDYRNNCTPLHYAARNNHIEIVQCLVEHNADIDAQDKFKRTPLHIAAYYDSIETVQYLVEHNADIDACDYLNRTPLHNAAQYNRIETVQTVN